MFPRGLTQTMWPFYESRNKEKKITHQNYLSYHQVTSLTKKPNHALVASFGTRALRFWEAVLGMSLFHLPVVATVVGCAPDKWGAGLFPQICQRKQDIVCGIPR